jgi:hypothetical protein
MKNADYTEIMPVFDDAKSTDLAGQSAVKLFEYKEVRSAWDADAEKVKNLSTAEDYKIETKGNDRREIESVTSDNMHLLRQM